MKKIFLATSLLSALAMTPATADETGERGRLVALVQSFFDAMTDRDAAHMTSLLTTDGIFYGYRDDADGLSIVQLTHQSYVENLAAGEQRLVERFWEPEILLHDRMAVVWTPYDLYIDGVFSHCGIDNFNFLKTDDGWKITGIVFSIERDGCPPSPLGPLQD